MTKSEFIQRMTVAIRETVKKGALFNPAVVVAQAALETGWGSTELAQKANNLFSIKAGGTWSGETIRLPGYEWHLGIGWRTESIVWRKYSNWTECLLDYAKIINNTPWFNDALKKIDDADGFLMALLGDGSEPGWATDPEYKEKVKTVAMEVQSLGGPPWEE